MKKNKGFIDDGLFIGLLVIFMVVGLGAIIYAAVKEGEQWGQFKEEHHCKVVSHISGDVLTTFGVSSSGKPVVGTTTTPSKTGWLCDDGITYYR